MAYTNPKGWVFKQVTPAEAVKGQTPITRNIGKIILHYSAIPAPKAGEIEKQLKAIDEHHRNFNRWMGIGYHFAVHHSGLIYQCRPINIIGAHCNGHNNNSVGVVMLDNGDHFDDEMLQLTTISLLSQMAKQLEVSREFVYLHRQFNQTTCPPLTKSFLNRLHKRGFTGIKL